MQEKALAVRRDKPRYNANGMAVAVRRKGRLGKLQGVATDFNQCGLGIVLDQPLSKDTTVIMSITTSDRCVKNILGVVHNCVSLPHGYRCGIQFRTNSPMQRDRCAIEAALCQLETMFAP